MHKTKPIMFVLAVLVCGLQLGCGANSASQVTASKPPPSVVTDSLTTGTVGTPYSQTLTAIGGVSPYKWSEQSGGPLPPGLTFDGNTGTIAGTPSTAGEYGPYVFLVTDSQELQVSSIELPLTIASTAASACPARGNEMALNASTPYAFVLQGYDQSGLGFVMAGSFTPRGDGSLSAGEVDYNGVKLARGHSLVKPSASGYAFGSDGRGCLFLSLPDSVEQSTFAFRFSLGGKNSSGVYSTGHIIEFENLTGTGPNASGNMHVQDPGTFRLDALQSNYAFGLTDAGEGLAGTFANDAGTLSAGFADFAPLSTTVLTGGNGKIASQFSSNGRGTGHYALSAQYSFDFAMYIVNGSDFYLISTTDVSNFETNPNGLLNSGRALATEATFGTHPLNGNYLFADLGGSFDSDPSSFSRNTEAIGALQIDSTGVVPEAKIYTSASGTTASIFNNGSYTSSAQGRIAFTGLGVNAPIIYLTSGGDVGDPVLGFTTSTNGFLGGVLVNQNTSSPSFLVSDLNGTYSGGTPADPGNQDGGGVYSCVFDGAGNFVATYDAFFNGHQSVDGATFSGIYTVNADGTGTLDATVSSDPNFHFVFVTNGSHIYAISSAAGLYSRLIVFDASSLP